MNRKFASILAVVVATQLPATPAQAQPATPTGLVARAAGPSSVALQWNDASSDETGFEVERLDGASWVPAGAAPANTRSFTVRGLPVNAPQSFRVRANSPGGSSAWAGPADATTTIRMNVIFFLADDMGYKDIVALRDPVTDGPTLHETPTLDTLASQARVFTNAYCSGPRCVVARRAIQTGMYDWRPEAVPASGGIDLENVTYGEAAKAAGYRTAFVGKYHLGDGSETPPRGPAAQGYDVSIAAGEYGAPAVSYFALETAPGSGNFTYELPDCDDGGFMPTAPGDFFVPLADTDGDGDVDTSDPNPYLGNGAPFAGEYLTDRLTHKTIGFIADTIENHPTQPFHVTLAHYAVHTPAEAKATDIAHFTARKSAMASALASHPKAASKIERDQGADVRMVQDNRVYAAMMKSYDDSLAALRAYLAATDDPRNPGKKLSETTILVVSSDHGGKSTVAANENKPIENDATDPVKFDGTLPNAYSSYPTANYPLRLGKTWVYEGGLKIPLIVLYPGLTSPGATDALAHQADFWATFADMTGAPPAVFNLPALSNGNPQTSDSVSLMAALADSAATPRSESPHFFTNANPGTGNPAIGALRRGDYKLLYFMVQRRLELYNIALDPGEQFDLASLRPDLAAEMLDELYREVLATGMQMPKPGTNSWKSEQEVLVDNGVIDSLPLPPDAAPANLTVTQLSPSALQLSWTANATNATHAVIYRSGPDERALNGGSDRYREIAFVPAGQTTFIDTNFSSAIGEKYKYRVESENLGGWNGFSIDASGLFSTGTTVNGVTNTGNVIHTLAAGAPRAVNALDDTITAVAGEPRDFNPLLNDAGEGTLAISTITQPTVGAATFDGRTIRFLPPADFSGGVTLTYTLIDSAAQTDTATVTINLPPTGGAMPAGTPGAYWAFQSAPTGTESETYNETVSHETLPGTPAFARTGSQLATFSGVGNYTFQNFAGETWEDGRTATWNSSSAACTGNSFQITFDTTGAENWNVRFSYRNNGTRSGGSPVTALTAFEFRVGSGAFQPVPGAALALDNGTALATWSVNLSSLSAIENAGPVTLRWTLPDFDQTTSTQLRLDDLQVTGSWKATGGTPPPEPPARARLLPRGNYNVLFLPVDDLKPLIDAYGDSSSALPRPITPNMDRLAARGVVFSRAYCQQAVCNASRASIMTGLRPDTTKCWDLETFFRSIPGNENVVTIPQHFGARGYSVHGIGKIFHGVNDTKQDGPLSWNEGWASASTGNTWYEAAKAAAEDAGNNKVSATDAGEINTRDGNRPVVDSDYNDGMAAQLGIAKIGAYAAQYRSTGKPFFLAVGFQKPHLPFTAPKAYWDMYDPNAIDLSGYDGARSMPSGTNDFTAPYGTEPGGFDDITGHPTTGMPTATEARRLIHGYLACVSFIDAQIGKLLDSLDDPDGNPATNDSITGQTVVVLWGDHGFHLGDHNGFWAKHSNYEEATRVPLILAAPGMESLDANGRFCHEPVELVDVFPTLVDLCSLPEPTQPAGLEMQGTSLMPLLEDPAQPWKLAAFSQFQRTISGPGVTNAGKGMGYSIRTSRYRYTEWWRTSSTSDTADLDAVLPGETGPQHTELYDHTTDPGETVNLSGNPAYASVAAELAAILHSSNPHATGTAGDGWRLESVDAPAAYPVTWADWQTAYDHPGLDPAQLDPEGDPDRDAIVNLFEYKFGTHPFLPDDPVVETDFQPGWLGLVYPDVAARSGVGLSVTSSTTLLPGSWSGAGVTTSTLNRRLGNAVYRAGQAPVTGSRIFLRVEAKAAP